MRPPPPRPAADLPAAGIRPLAFRRLRERFAAPELERLLAQKGADLGALDQVEALRVRVRAGVAVVEERARAAAREARSIARSAALTAALAVALSVAAWAVIESGLVALLLQAALLAALALSARALALARRDLRTLEGIDGRYRAAIEEPVELEELLALSRTLFEEVDRVAGGIGEGRR